MLVELKHKALKGVNPKTSEFIKIASAKRPALRSSFARPSAHSGMNEIQKECVLDHLIDPPPDSGFLAFPRSRHFENLDPVFLNEPVQARCRFKVHSGGNVDTWLSGPACEFDGQ